MRERLKEKLLILRARLSRLETWLLIAMGLLLLAMILYQPSYPTRHYFRLKQCRQFVCEETYCLECELEECIDYEGVTYCRDVGRQRYVLRT